MGQKPPTFGVIYLFVLFHFLFWCRNALTCPPVICWLRQIRVSNYRISKITKPQLHLNSEMAWLNPQRRVKGKTEGIDGSFCGYHSCSMR